MLYDLEHMVSRISMVKKMRAEGSCKISFQSGAFKWLSSLPSLLYLVMSCSPEVNAVDTGKSSLPVYLGRGNGW